MSNVASPDLVMREFLVRWASLMEAVVLTQPGFCYGRLLQTGASQKGTELAWKKDLWRVTLASVLPSTFATLATRWAGIIVLAGSFGVWSMR